VKPLPGTKTEVILRSEVNRTACALLFVLQIGFVISLDRFPIGTARAAPHPDWQGESPDHMRSLVTEPVARKHLLRGSMLSSLAPETDIDRDPQSVGLPEGRTNFQADARQPNAQISEETLSTRKKLEYFAIVVGGAILVAILLLVFIRASGKEEPHL
jgi:hypothetical protein